MATIRDVARESGVSVATVSYVLNNGPRPVGAQTRERVLDVMRRMSYRPNATAQRLAGRQMHTVGVLFNYVEAAILINPYAATLLQGVMAAAADARYNVTLFTSPWESADTSAIEFQDGRTDGILVVAPQTDSDVVSGLAAMRTPVVSVSGPSATPGVPFVDVDNVAGARLATEHLIALGHTRIAQVGGNTHHADIAVRRNSFLETMAAAGLSVPPEMIPQGSYHWPDARVIFTRLLSLPDRPTAVFAGNDTLAVLCLETARELGLRVPEDLSIVGFDDLPTASVITPQLTTVRQPLVEIGARATRILIGLVEAGERTAGSPADSQLGEDGILLDPELVVRGSTGPPPR